MKTLLLKLHSERTRTKIAYVVGEMSGIGLLFELTARLFRDSTYIDPFHDRMTGALFILTAALLIVNEIVLQKRAACHPVVLQLCFAATAAGIMVSAFTAAASWPILPIALVMTFAMGFGLLALTPFAAVCLLALQLRALHSGLKQSREDHGKLQMVYALTVMVSTAAWMWHIWSVIPPHSFL